MASYNELIALIDAFIKRNGVQAITGQILNGVLKAMVDQVGRGYAIMGVATPSTNPGTPDAPESWFASTPGTYTNFGGLEVADAEFALLSYTPSGEVWTKTTLTEGIQEVSASIDGNVGTPEVTAEYINGSLIFTFSNMKGQTGDAAGFGTVNAMVDENIGIPGVSVNTSGPDTAKNITFAFRNLKGETGVTSVVATVDNTSGAPSCAVSLVGQELHLDFHGLKGAQGDTGVSADFPITIANNLTTDDPTAALSAAQGVVLAGELSQLEAELAKVDTDKIILSDDDLRTYAVMTTGYYGTNGNYKHKLVNVSEGEEYLIVAIGATGARYAFLSQIDIPVSGAQIPLVQGTSVMEITSGEWVKVTIPTGCVAIIFHFGSSPYTNYKPDLYKYISIVQLKQDVEILEGKAVPFAGTDGTNPGTAGFVPAPTASDTNKMLTSDGTWKDVPEDEVLYSEQVSVTSTGQRTRTYNNINPGDKIVVRVTMVSGVGSVFSVYWNEVSTDSEASMRNSVGNFTAVLTAPAGTTRIRVFLNKYGSGVKYQVDVYNASKNKYFTDELDAAGTLPFVNSLTPAVLTKSLEVSSSDQYILDTGYPDNYHRYGPVYAFINSLTAKLAPDVEVYFLYSNGSAYQLFAREIAIRPVLVLDNPSVYLESIKIPANGVEIAGDISISLYGVIQQVQDYSRPLKGRRVMCFGDSLTQFRNSNEPRRYTDYLAMLSMADVKNAGVGGTRLAQRETPSATPSSNQQCVAAFDICNLVTAWATGDYTLQDAAIASGLLTDAQQPIYEAKVAVLKDNPVSGMNIVTIFGGTNDYTGGSAIGMDSQSTTDKGTIYGAVNAMVSALLTANPNLKIYFFSPTIRMFQSSVSLETSSDVYVHSSAPDGKTLPEFIEVIKDAVVQNHIPYCDMYWSLGWNVYNFTNFFGTDYTHPYKGFQVIAEKIYKYLLSE